MVNYKRTVHKRRYVIGGRSVWGTREGKNYKKKGYFESADELLSLKNNLSLSKTEDGYEKHQQENSHQAGFCCVYRKNKNPQQETRKLYFSLK